MSIKFVCSCGKRLRARDEMAGRRSQCPRCGNPVGIPFLHPAHPDVAPMTPAERLARRHRSVAPASAEPENQLVIVPPNLPENPLDAVVDRRTARLLAAHPEAATALRKDLAVIRRRRRGEMGTRWYHCLFYPLRAGALVFALAQALTYLSFIAAFLFPDLLDLDLDVPKQSVASSLWVSACVAAVGYAWAFLNCVLTSSAAGEVRQVRWPGRDIILVLRTTVGWLVCFIAGPVIPAAVASLLWLHCREPAPVDLLVVGELGIVAASLWLLGIVSYGRTGRLRDANPLAVADLAGELGFGPLLIVLAGGILAMAHCFWAFFAVAQLERNMGLGLAWLAVCWPSGMYWATFVMRYLGLSCYRKLDTAP